MWYWFPFLETPVQHKEIDNMDGHCEFSVKWKFYGNCKTTENHNNLRSVTSKQYVDNQRKNWKLTEWKNVIIMDIFAHRFLISIALVANSCNFLKLGKHSLSLYLKGQLQLCLKDMNSSVDGMGRLVFNAPFTTFPLNIHKSKQESNLTRRSSVFRRDFKVK